jgi:hypothetical protein
MCDESKLLSGSSLELQRETVQREREALNYCVSLLFPLS